MRKFTVIPGGRLLKEVVDGPGWTDVDGYQDSEYVQTQYCCSPNKHSYENLAKRNTLTGD